MTRFARGLAVFVALAAASPAIADVIHLNTGGVVKGEIVRQNRREIVVRMESGTTTAIPRTDIERIVAGASPEEMYRERLDRIDPSDPEARYALGLWLKSIRCPELAEEEFLATVELEPDHRFARLELGHVRQDGEWVERATVEASAEVDAEATARRERRRALRGASRVLNQAIEDLRSDDADARADAWAVLGDEEAEARRMVAALVGGSQGAWSALRREVPAAEELDPELATEEELLPLALGYVEAKVRPGVDLSLERHARHLERLAERVDRAYEGLLREYEADDAERAELLADWGAARDEALRVIFDKSIYPDENHGRAGQPTVDEKVAVVRSVWERFDAYVERDLARLLALDPEDAKELLARSRELEARYAELQAFQRRRGLAATPSPTRPALYDVLVAYQGGDLSVVERRDELAPYEQYLLQRLRDERVRAYNAAFAGANPHDYGQAPTGNEVEQVRITNDYRIMMGRRALEIDPRLVQSARGHSRDMTQGGFFDHTSPIPGKRTPFERMAKAGYPGGGGENISLGMESPQATHDGWYNSSGHHRNILGAGWTAMGSGQDGRHWTQNFGQAATLRR